MILPHVPRSCLVRAWPPGGHLRRPASLVTELSPRRITGVSWLMWLGMPPVLMFRNPAHAAALPGLAWRNARRPPPRQARTTAARYQRAATAPC
jgi:hypothetical protein